jgi:hypothetical protein
MCHRNCCIQVTVKLQVRDRDAVHNETELGATPMRYYDPGGCLTDRTKGHSVDVGYTCYAGYHFTEIDAVKLYKTVGDRIGAGDPIVEFFWAGSMCPQGIYAPSDGQITWVDESLRNGVAAVKASDWADMLEDIVLARIKIDSVESYENDVQLGLSDESLYLAEDIASGRKKLA